MPWLDPMKLGPFRPEDYLYTYFLVALPTLLVCGDVLRARDRYALDADDLCRRRGLSVLTVLTVVRQAAIRPHRGFAGAVRTSAPSAKSTKYWTASDRDTMLPPLSVSSPIIA